MLFSEETPGKGPGDSRGFEGLRSHPNLISEPHPYPQPEKIDGCVEGAFLLINGSNPKGYFHMISA